MIRPTYCRSQLPLREAAGCKCLRCRPVHQDKTKEKQP